jgi:cell shape-determining protein MreC
MYSWNMKRISRSGRRPFLFTLPGLLLLGAVLGVAAALLWWREPLAAGLWRIGAPLMTLRNNLGATAQADLRAQVEALRAQVADRDALYEENLYLKRLLGRAPAEDTVLAAITMRPPGSPYDTLLIDAGHDAGLVPGNLVSGAGGTLIGSVTAVYGRSARVTLFSSPGEQYAGLLLRGGEQVAPLTVVGQGSGALYADIPAGTGALVGDAVVVPGLRTGVFAVVSAVEVEDSGSFERVHLHLPVNPQHLRFVEVWRSDLLP